MSEWYLPATLKDYLLEEANFELEAAQQRVEHLTKFILALTTSEIDSVEAWQENGL